MGLVLREQRRRDHGTHELAEVVCDASWNAARLSCYVHNKHGCQRCADRGFPRPNQSEWREMTNRWPIVEPERALVARYRRSMDDQSRAYGARQQRRQERERWNRFDSPPQSPARGRARSLSFAITTASNSALTVTFSFATAFFTRMHGPNPARLQEDVPAAPTYPPWEQNQASALGTDGQAALQMIDRDGGCRDDLAPSLDAPRDDPRSSDAVRRRRSAAVDLRAGNGPPATLQPAAETDPLRWVRHDVDRALDLASYAVEQLNDTQDL